MCVGLRMSALSMYELNKDRYDRLGIKDWDEFRERKILI